VFRTRRTSNSRRLRIPSVMLLIKLVHPPHLILFFLKIQNFIGPSGDKLFSPKKITPRVLTAEEAVVETARQNAQSANDLAANKQRLALGKKSKLISERHMGHWMKKLRRSSDIPLPASKDDAKSSLALAMAAVEEARSQAHLVNDCEANAKYARIPYDVYADLGRK